MKLINKFILVYLLISLFVFSLGGVISFYTFSTVNDSETDAELWGQTHQVSKLLKRGTSSEALSEDREMNIKILKDTTDLQISTVYKDTTDYHHASRAVIPYRKITAVRKINDVWYQIEIHNSLLEPEDTFIGAFVSNTLIFFLSIIFTFLLSFLISKWLLDPFKVSLTKIKNFSLHDKEALEFNKTNTLEFDQMNQFIHQMTKKALTDYNNLREFSENIAHEIRTPLAIASGKLDLLLQLDNLKSEDLKLISQAQESIKKISNIQHSLGILSRIENEEFNQEIHVNLSQLVNNVIEDHADITHLRGIEVSTIIEEGVGQVNDPIMIEMLVTNLFQNAIKHNIQEGGYIKILLDHHRLVFENSGNKISQPTRELMGRFKKNGHTKDSLGLGLSIVQDICTKSQYQFSYTFEDVHNIHRLEIVFKTSLVHQN